MGIQSHTIHVCYIYLHLPSFYHQKPTIHVAKYTIHCIFHQFSGDMLVFKGEFNGFENFHPHFLSVKNRVDFLRAICRWKGSFNAFNPSMLAGLAAAVAVVATGMIADCRGVGVLLSRWWFQIFFIFTAIWGRFPF